MKRYLLYLAAVIAISLLLVAGTFAGIVCVPKNVFYTSYQSLIQDKFRILQETDEPKIIMVAGSSSAFGLDQRMLEDATGYKVANLGLHAGFGALFYTELSKANINPGDIVLLGYEYSWAGENAFDRLGTELVMSGIDSNIEMYRYIPLRKWQAVLGYLFTYAEKKNAYSPASGIYSREAFDSSTAQLAMRRDYSIDYDKDVYGEINIDGMISEHSVKYLKGYKEFVQSHGAEVYFVAPPLLVDSIVCDWAAFDKLKEQEEEKIGIPYISNPREYFFPADLMSDAVYHCNTEGEALRTKMLIEDLKLAGAIK